MLFTQSKALSTHDLAERVASLEAANAELAGENTELRERLDRLETVLAAISGPLAVFTEPAD